MVDVDRRAIARNRERQVVAQARRNIHISPLPVRIRQLDRITIYVHGGNAVGPDAESDVRRPVAVHCDLASCRGCRDFDIGGRIVFHGNGVGVLRREAVFHFTIRIDDRRHQILGAFGLGCLGNKEPEIAASVPAIPVVCRALGENLREVGGALFHVDAPDVLVVIEQFPRILGQSSPITVCHLLVDYGRIAIGIGMRGSRNPWYVLALHVGAPKLGRIQDAIIQEFVRTDGIRCRGNGAIHRVDLGALGHQHA